VIRIIALAVLAAVAGFGQDMSWDKFTMPKIEKGKRIVDANNSLSVSTKTEGEKLLKSNKSTLVVVPDLPAIDSEHKYPAGFIADYVGKKYHLGEHARKKFFFFGPRKRSILLVVTGHRGNPVMRWSLNYRETTSAAYKKANNKGFHEFGVYMGKEATNRRAVGVELTYKSAIQALTTQVWPALK
jgi:hypothetical protein